MFKSFSLFQNVAFYFLFLDSGYGKAKDGAKVVFPFFNLFLEDICFIILCWFLPYNSLNQPQVYIYPLPLGFPRGSDDKESACSAGDQVQSLSWEDPWRREWQPTPEFLPGESHGQRGVVGYSP